MPNDINNPADKWKQEYARRSSEAKASRHDSVAEPASDASPALAPELRQPYEAGGIPSSVRESPSGSVVWAVETLRRHFFPLRDAVDIGCGKGRNSLYLAEQGLQVTAMDFTPDAVEHVQTEAAAKGLASRLRPLTHDVTEPWPMAPHSVDVAIDAFCFKHIAPHEARMAYKDNLLRVLRGQGHYMVSFASIGDGYYGQYVTEKRGEEELIAIDPIAGIESVLYTRDAILRFFAPELVLFDELHQAKPGMMHGKEYPRSTYALLLKRNPHINT